MNFKATLKRLDEISRKFNISEFISFIQNLVMLYHKQVNEEMTESESMKQSLSDLVI